MDLNSADVVEQIQQPTEEIIDREYLASEEDNLRNQYVNFIDMGYDCIRDIENDQIKLVLLQNLIDYADKYITVSKYEEIKDNDIETLKYGYIIYRFLCVDSYNIFIPNFLGSLSISSMSEFDRDIRKNFPDYNDIKMFFVKIVNSTLETFLNLKKIVGKDILDSEKNYNIFLERLTIYKDLVMESDGQKFIENFLRPVINKNFEDLVWRIA